MKASLHLRRAACAAPAASGTDVYDVVIVGGGMVGAAFGALLLSHPLTAALRVLVRAAPRGSKPALPALAGPRRAVRGFPTRELLAARSSCGSRKPRRR
jgi:glycine/D-amino acid oxidase-like deaminating enzyme